MRSAFSKERIRVGHVQHQRLNNLEFSGSSSRKYNHTSRNGRLRHPGPYAASGMALARDAPWYMALFLIWDSGPR